MTKTLGRRPFRQKAKIPLYIARFFTSWGEPVDTGSGSCFIVAISQIRLIVSVFSENRANLWPYIFLLLPYFRTNSIENNAG